MSNAKMSVAGLKKQIYKATQMMSEKVGGAEGTKLDEDFKELERRADITTKAIVDVVTKTADYLQPNPGKTPQILTHHLSCTLIPLLSLSPVRSKHQAALINILLFVPAYRARLAMLSSVSKIRGQTGSNGYPQSEALLGDCMLKYGGELPQDSNFGGALLEVGEYMRRLAEVKDSLDIDVKQNFMDPLQSLVEKDLKDIQHHLKKMEGRRLDYDYKKKRQGKISEDDVRQALEKFHESRDSAETSMQNLLETDIEQVTQLAALVNSQLQYHRQATSVLEELTERMKERMSEAESSPRQKSAPRRRFSADYSQEDSNGGHRSPSANQPVTQQPCCKALYDFEPENDGELAFQEGDIIILTSRIDENWLEGTVRGQSGYFPCNYVDVLVPLSH
ncbi:endophilin-A2-like isoform X2 [Denticeps clupeoides]|uniref:endophilin-A2-like isoform X2 n=1 Tax=Denticeps clupeoides TaxID=299321 RepID=UPI0010A443CB|nr:endophilin-A2-like isoform X2 [Denticeps clupeoides]